MLITIRSLSEQDLDSLVSLYNELYHVPTHLGRMRESFRTMATNPDYLVIGAFTEQGELVGSALAIICLDLIAACKPWAVVENVIVTDRVRGQGIGKLLLNKVEEFAHYRGCSYIQLTSSYDRQPAHRFYKAIGYSDDIVLTFRKRL